MGCTPCKEDERAQVQQEPHFMTPKNKIQKLGGIQRPMTPESSFVQPTKLEKMRLQPEDLDEIDKVQMVNNSAMNDTT